MSSEELNESKQFYTEVAKTKCRQNAGGHNKQMYWSETVDMGVLIGTITHELFVEAWRGGQVKYTKA